jgi:AraC-like DNA-binding protein
MSKAVGIIATTLFAIVLVAAIAYSVMEQSQHYRVQTVCGLISVDMEPFFNDDRVKKLLESHQLKVEATRVGSRTMSAQVAAPPTGPDFFLPSGVLAAQMITEAAKQRQLVTTSYSPFYSPLVVASWEPVAQILMDNQAAARAGNRVYDLYLGKVLDLMLQKKRWKDIDRNGRYDVSRSVLIATTDPRTSNSGALYLALASHALNGYEVVSDREKARQLVGPLAELCKRQGYQENYVNTIFDDYLSIGMGKVPLAFIYEYQIVQYAIARKLTPADAVLLYPKPTVFDKQVLVALNEPAKKLGDLLSTNRDLQKIAAEYGFRSTDPTLFKAAVDSIGFAVKERVDDVIDPPSRDIMAEFIDGVADRMK